MQVGTAKVACRGLGFEDGFFSVANPPSVVRPPWLANIRCSGNETDVSACMGFEFGATRTCGPGRRGVKRLFCFNEVSSASLLEGTVLAPVHSCVVAQVKTQYESGCLAVAGLAALLLTQA